MQESSILQVETKTGAHFHTSLVFTAFCFALKPREISMSETWRIRFLNSDIKAGSANLTANQQATFCPCIPVCSLHFFQFFSVISVASFLRNGVFEWRRPDVPYPGGEAVLRSQSEVLWGGNSFGPEILA